MQFSADIGTRKLTFTAPNPQKAYERAKKWETVETLNRLSLLNGSVSKVIWDPINDYGVVPKPPRNWKWWWKAIFHHCIYHPVLPFMFALQVIFPKLKIPYHRFMHN